MDSLNVLKWIVFFLLPVTGFALEPDPVCPLPLRVHVDLTAPSAFLDAQKQVRGMDADLIRAIFSEAHCPVEFELTPRTGARILKALQEGEIDVMIRASKTAERTTFAFFTEPYRDEIVGVFAHKPIAFSKAITLTDALQQRLQLIGPASGWYGNSFESLRQHYKTLNLYTPYPDAKVATELLFASPSRGDLLVVDADIFFYYAGAGRLNDIEPIGDWLHVTPAHLMLSKKTVQPALVERLDQAISRLQQQGVLQQIEQQYRPELLQRMMRNAQQKGVRFTGKPLK